MSTRLLLEGPDLPALLERVHAEHGPNARIVSAEKVRTGGIAGFFARERFEVQVEVAASAADEAGRAAAAAGAGAPKGSTSGSDLSTEEGRSRAGEGSRPAPGPASLEGLVDLVDTVERATQAVERATQAGGGPGLVEQPVVSTETHDFAELLAALQAASSGPPAPAAPAPPATPAPATPAPATPAPATPATPAQSAAPPSPLLTALRQLPTAPRLPRAAGSIIAVLGQAGPGLEVASCLAARLRVSPGTILLAAPDGHTSGVPVARRLVSPEDAHRRVGRLRRAPRPTVVVVDAPLEDAAADWARQVVDALEAHSVWAVVDARVKPADLAAHLDRLGRVDALAVYGARQTIDPGTVLSLGYPVGLLDGGPATPRVWEGLLGDQLEAAQRRGAPPARDSQQAIGWSRW